MGRKSWRGCRKSCAQRGGFDLWGESTEGDEKSRTVGRKSWNHKESQTWKGPTKIKSNSWPAQDHSQESQTLLELCQAQVHVHSLYFHLQSPHRGHKGWCVVAQLPRALQQHKGWGRAVKPAHKAGQRSLTRVGSRKIPSRMEPGRVRAARGV